MAVVHSEGNDDEALRKWVDDVLHAGDDWVDARLTQWVDGRVAEWAKEKSGGSKNQQEPGPREGARERARILGDKRGLALRRAEIAQEFAAAARAVGTRNGHDDESAALDWFDTRLREEALAWLEDAGRSWRFGLVNENLFRFMSDALSAWVAREAEAGRQPGSADVAAKRAAI